MKKEILLEENKDRFVLFPIKYPKIWEMLIEGKEKVYFAISAGSAHNHPDRETIEAIRQAALDAGVKAEIYPTNLCQGCVDQLDIPEWDCDEWTEVLDKGVKYKERNADLRTMVKQNRSETYKDWEPESSGKKSPKSIAAYALDFDLTTGESKVYKGLSHYVANPYPACSKDQCRYR